jgi:methionine synthase II (cobalamin-independent)
MIVTGVGSLPHTDAASAVEFVMDTASLPYVPQLPEHDEAEGMIAQWSAGLCTHAATSDDGPAGFGGARELLARHGPVLRDLKTQATGPVTLAVALVNRGHDPATVWDCVVPGLIDLIRAHLGEIAAGAPGSAVTVILDEPSLVAFGPGPAVPAEARSRAMEAIRDVIGALHVPVGVHCCADTDWSLVTESGPSVISWDLAELGSGFHQSLEALADAIATGTQIAWGVVPVTGAALPAAETIAGRYRAALAELVVAGAPVQPMREDAWATPACGLVGLTVGQAERVMDRVGDVVGEITGELNGT